MKNWLIVQASKVKKWTGEKVMTLTMTKLNQLMIESFVELEGPNAGLKRAFEGGMTLGHEFMMELAAHLEDKIERVLAYGEGAWIMFSGHAPTDASFREFEVDGVKIYEYILNDANCPWCKNIEFPHRFCQFPAGAYQGAAQTWSLLTQDNGLKVLSREIKCKAVGDEFCEWKLLFFPKDTPIEFAKEHFPEMFEDVDTGYIEY